MFSPKYYREQAYRTRRLAEMEHQTNMRETLEKAAEDLDVIAEDLELETDGAQSMP